MKNLKIGEKVSNVLTNRKLIKFTKHRHKRRIGNFKIAPILQNDFYLDFQGVATNVNFSAKTSKRFRKILSEFIKTCRFVNLFITNSCTCRCTMCNFWRQNKTFMKDSIFMKTANVLEGLGFYNFSLTGGEPLLHPKYFDFVKILKHKGFYVNSPTNGTLLTERNVKRLRESGIDSVSVSIDSLNPEVADKVRHYPGQLHSALNGLKLLKKYGIPSSAIVLLAKHNIHEYSEIIKKLDAEYDTPSILCFPDAGIGPLEDINFNKNELVKLLDELLILKKEGYRLLNATEYLREIKRAYLNQKRCIPCYGGYYYVNVYWDGRVTPCFNKGTICHINYLSVDSLRKRGCTDCLNQCFIEFSYISDCMARKKFFTLWKERSETLELHFLG